MKASDTKMPGTLDARLGDYTVEGILGEGGGGVVYAAHGPQGPVALKVTHANRELTTRDRERYLGEAEMMRRVRHPAIVEVLDAGLLPDERPYVAMPRLDGQTLADRITKQGPLPLDEALDLFDQLADATTAMHACDLLHRDLKAENVFLMDRGRLKLLDFGIAKDQRETRLHTTTGLVRGTPATMAPERFFGEPASEQSDVYELAVVFYVMVAGKLPWAGDETDVRARAHPLPLHQAVASVPPAVGHALMAALATRPGPRPRNPHMLAATLREAAREPSEPSLPLGGPTVTSDNLRALVANETPFEAAVASRPHRPAPTARRWLAMPVAAAVAILGFVVWSPEVSAPAARAGISAISPDLPEPTYTVPIEASAEPASEPPPMMPSASATAHPKAVAPAPPRNVRAASPAASASVAVPAPPATSDPIPGGVHGASPY